MKNSVGRPKKFSSVEELENAIEAYFEKCDNGMKNGEPFPIPYTVEGLAAELEMDRKTLLNYSKEKGYEEFFLSIKKAKHKVLANLSERMLNGDNSTAGAIFLLKNNYGYADKVEQEVTSNNITTVVFEGEPGERIKFANNEDEINVDRESRAYKKE